MKNILIVSSLLVLYNIGFAQQSREEKLQHLKSRDDIKVTEIENDILSIEYPSGKVLYKNIAYYQPPITDNLIYSPTFDSTIIDLRTIDTTLYYQKYSFWQEVPVSAGMGPVPITATDINQNYLPELYGYEKHSQTSIDSLPLKIFELDLADSLFKVAYTYPDSIIEVNVVYDINNDGQLQLFTSNNNRLSRSKIIYKKPSPNSFAIIEDFNFTAWNGIRDPTLGDYNNNGSADLVYYSLDRYSAIAEYSPIFNRFDSVYAFPEPDIDCGGFSTKDIDGDGYPDIVLGTIHGFVRVLEYQKGTGYLNIWNDTLDTYNVYVHFTTSDIDGNGKPEFWVGGDAFYSGIPKTLYTCYESDGNNNYKIVAKIWLIGVFSTDAYNAFAIDVDKDGVEELGVCVDQRFLILKFTGSPNQHSYELYYFKKNEIASNYNVYYGASMYDLTGDSHEEILISRQQSNNGLRLFTSIYCPATIVPVELISFTAIASSNNVLLNWSTASELNNKGFEIERKVFSQYGVVIWEKVGFVEGYGTTSQHQNYSYKDSNLTSGKYSYRLKQIDYDGSCRNSQEIEVNLCSPLRYSLEQNYPNPFNPVTKIKYVVPNVETRHAPSLLVTLNIYDVLGKEIAVLVNEEKQPGIYEVEFNALQLSSGIYFYTLKTSEFKQTRKMILAK